MTKKVTRKSWTLNEIKQAQRKAAQKEGKAWWFGPDETRFFDSAYHDETFTGRDGKVYFVTSEQCHFSDGTSAPRGWTVRVWDPKRPSSVDHLGAFQQFTSLRAALANARDLAR